MRNQFATPGLLPRLLSVWACFGGGAAAAGEFDAGRVGFAVRAGGVHSSYSVLALAAMPGERLELETSRPAVLVDGRSPAQPRNRSNWTAPREPGLYRLALESAGERMELNVFVLRPAAEVQDESLRGYRIGAYTSKPFRNLETYKAPRGFVEVTPEVLDVRVSPHFVLGQFLCKQESGWPKYVVLRPKLLLKLEYILEQLNLAGVRTDELTVMSGFRTPWYNASIGNKTTSSRHLYGGAADIYVDVSPRDGQMDDLDGNGRIEQADAVWLYDRIEEWSRHPAWKDLDGGLGAYGATAAHGPFVHVDVRGYRARW